MGEIPADVEGFNSTLVRVEGKGRTLSIPERTRFNSTLVRVEARWECRHKADFLSFNSTLVRVEAPYAVKKAGVGVASFNSTLVRVEVRSRRGARDGRRSFNSTLVRVEVVRFGERGHGRAGLFQFHIGSSRGKGYPDIIPSQGTVSIPHWFE